VRVLIIEDSAEIVEAISLCLQLQWPEITISSTDEGTRGVEILESESFDMVLLDISLPDIEGFEVLKRVRSFSNVPVIILTARVREEDKAIGLEMGADDYIVKPFRVSDLVTRMNALLHRDISPGVTEE